MTPLWIELEGIRSFVAPRRVDFTNLGLFAILGDTGAGKSSILEGIVYALFNGTTWDGRNVKELMSVGAARMRVSFCFELNGRKFTVSRATPREGAANHLLECADAPEERRDGDRAIATRIEELLGVDRETFTKTVVLPQGEFAELLKLSPARRTKLLTDILGLNVIDDMASALSVPRERANLLRATLKGKRSQLPPDPATALLNAVEANDRARLATSALDAAVKDTRRREASIAGIDRKLGERAELRRRLEVARPALVDLEALSSTDLLLAKETESVEKVRSDAVARQQQIDTELDRLEKLDRDVAGLARIDGLLASFAGAAVERRRDLDEMRRRRANLTKALADVARATEKLAIAEQARDAIHSRNQDAQEASRVSAAALSEAERAFSGVETARDLLEKSTKALSEARVRGALLSEQMDVARAAAVDADKVALEARTLLEQMRRANAAADAAHGLHSGDACPICERELPSGFNPPAAPNLARSRDNDKKATTLAQSAHGKAAKAEAEAESHKQAIANAAAEQVRLLAALSERERLAQSIGVDAVASDPKVALKPLAMRAAELLAIANDLAKQTITAGNVVATEGAKHKSNLDACESCDREVSLSLAAIAARDLAITSLLNDLPEEFRPRDVDDDQSLKVLRAGLGEALKVAQNLDKTRTEAIRAVSSATENLRLLDAKRDREVATPQRTVCAHLTAVAALLGNPESSPSRSAVPKSALLPAVIEWAITVVEDANKALLALAVIDQTETQQRAAEESAIATLLAQHEAATGDELNDSHISAVQAAALAASALKAAKQAGEDAAELDLRLAIVEPLARTLDALHSALGDSRFKRFVASRKEERLLGVATEILRRMTDDRYGFGIGLRIVDRSAGQERSAETLSGGEKFLASLALSLALVEIAMRSGGRFGALFLDEGFGTLDLNALDEALTELERQAADGRMIGVITHVREVTEYIDDVLRVIKTPSGSEVQRLDRSEFEMFVAEQLLPAPA